MFSDDGLASLLDRYPRDRLGVYTMGNDPQNWRTFVRGDAGNLSGEALLKAVKTGRFWLNLRAVNEHLEDYDALKQEMFSDFDARTGQRSLKQDLGVLISSPNAQVFYHLDRSEIFFVKVFSKMKKILQKKGKIKVYKKKMKKSWDLSCL